MPDYKNKRFTFWHARFTPEPYRKTLQQLLKSRFDKTTVRDRLLPLSEETNYQCFINYKTDIEGYFCANFFGYEKGRIGQVIKEAFDTPQINPSILPVPPADDGTNQQFLDRKLYFVCFKNRLVLAQDMYLKAKHLERYLNKMLRVTLPSRQGLVLEPSIPLKVHDRITGVKGIHLSAPLSHHHPEYQSRKTGNPLLDSLDFLRFDTRGFIGSKDIEVAVSLIVERKKERANLSPIGLPREHLSSCRRRRSQYRSRDADWKN